MYHSGTRVRVSAALAVLALAVDAKAASVVYSISNGLYKSTDGGTTWSKMLLPPSPSGSGTPSPQTLAIDPAAPSTVYAWGRYTTTGPIFMFRSPDAGQTWSSVQQPSYFGNGNLGPDAFVIDPVTSNVMYTHTLQNGVVRSMDSGLTWTQLTIPKSLGAPGAGPNVDQPSISTISIDPNNTGVVYAVGPRNGISRAVGYLLKSTDYGNTWSSVAQALEISERIYVDPNNSQVLYGSNTAGLCLSTPANGGRCGLYKSSDGGQSWASLSIFSQSVPSLAFDAHPGVIYATGYPAQLSPTVFKSVDAGATWTQVLQGFVLATPLVRADPGTPSTVYATGTSVNMSFRSTDGGANWTPVQGFYDLVVAPPAPAQPPPPVVSSVVNGASFQPGIAANSWVTIKGTNLASQTGDWSNAIVNGKLPTTLNGVSVSIGGKPAYVYFTSPGQLNVLAPDLSPGSVTVTVTTAAGTSSGFTATASQYGPAFFPWPGNQPVATRQDFSFAVKPGTFPGATTVAAKPGEVIILWATGFGPTNPAAPAGSATPSDKIYGTATSPTVTVNGNPVIVFGAALAPGSAGVYQIAIQVPNTLADGDYPIQASIGGVQSPGGTILSVHQ
jgi:uncharacterized protein (TIGR03437 family)